MNIKDYIIKVSIFGAVASLFLGTLWTFLFPCSWKDYLKIFVIFAAGHIVKDWHIGKFSK